MENIPENLEALLRSLVGDDLREDRNSKKVRHSSGQVMRLSPDAKRTEQGYRGAEVSVGPSRREQAYVAAILALKGEEMERESDKKNHQADKMARASKAILFFELMRVGRTDEAAQGAVCEAMKRLGLFKEEPSKGTDMIDGFRLTPLYELLRYFRPDFDRMSEKERIALLERAIGYANDYLKALRRLTAFLQYGEAGAYEGLATKQVTKAANQVRAAELREVVKTARGNPLPYNKIGKLLGEKPAPNQTRRSYDRRIQRMVEAGRDILKQAHGEQEYQDYIEARRAEIEHWQALGKDERAEIHMRENFDIGPEDAYGVLDLREILEKKTPKTS
jgi:hypothetical protein